MTILWICGLPRGIRQVGFGHQSELSWVVGHLPPPKGVDLHVLCPVRGVAAPETFVERGATWHLYPLKAYEPLFLRRRFARSARKFVQDLHPDVIHGWGGETGWGLLATYFSKRAIVGVQGLLRMLPGRGVDGEGSRLKIGGWLRLWLERMTYRRAGICLCESETAKRELKRLYRVEGVVVPQPLRPEFLGDEKVKVRGEGEQRTVKYLFVGQDVARKGIQDVREAFRCLSTSTRQASELTTVTGGKSAAEIVELMRTHDVFVLPSYGDTGPTAIKEALAMGMPVIAYDNTGPKELLEKYGGTLVKTGDVAARARAMREVGEGIGGGDGGGGREEDGPCRVGEVEKRLRIRQDLSREKVWEQLLAVYGLPCRGGEGQIRIAVLMTCHNRKESTLRCLDSLLAAANRVEGIGREWTVDVFLNDDGSTDGTSGAVQEWHKQNAPLFPFIFPLHLLHGSGHDFWAKGMARAWQAAIDYEKEHFNCSTFFLWLNDDIILKPDALSTLLHLCTADPDAVLNGTLVDSAGTPVYGLNVRNTGLAGNCVLVPRVVYEKVGMICGRYAHAWADRDYGLQVEKAGFRIVSAGVVGTTEWHPHRPSLAGVGFVDRCRLLTDPKGWNVRDLWLLRYRNWNVFCAVASCVHLIAHVLRGERLSHGEMEKGR